MEIKVGLLVLTFGLEPPFSQAQRLVLFVVAFEDLGGEEDVAPAVVPVISLVVCPKILLLEVMKMKESFVGLGEREPAVEDWGERL